MLKLHFIYEQKKFHVKGQIFIHSVMGCADYIMYIQKNALSWISSTQPLG